MKHLENQEPYPIEVLKLNDPMEFVRLFREQLANGSTPQDAYKSVEDQYIRLFGQRRYSNYTSFYYCIANKYSMKVTDL